MEATKLQASFYISSSTKEVLIWIETFLINMQKYWFDLIAEIITPSTQKSLIFLSPAVSQNHMSLKKSLLNGMDSNKFDKEYKTVVLTCHSDRLKANRANYCGIFNIHFLHTMSKFINVQRREGRRPLSRDIC